MFGSVLIANRGEIARRIMRTCRRLGIESIAVYSDADRDAPHMREADRAIRIGRAAPAESYLNIAAILGAARKTGAESIHPGYGFLAENAEFAEAVAQAGLVFIGPPAGAIRAMGSKAAARAAMERAGVPLVPGYQGDNQSDAALSRAAESIGYPVLIKPALGGGGKGMRRVENPAGLIDACAASRREAEAAFGDGRLIIERALDKPRHVEVQIFADSHGDIVHLFERDCSAQRRHQKVVEEAPAPGIDAATRAAMCDAAIDAARAVGYVGAGTVEFLLATDGAFHFIEMNTRLQVEHPVTEMITGLDLVEWQLRIAAGEALPLRQAEIAMNGHAIEARLYAEDPEAGFLPRPGRIDRLRLPEDTADVRVDAALGEGDEVPREYDPMIAKIIAHGPDRDAARARLGAALGQIRVAGARTNAALLWAMMNDPDFAAGTVHVTWLEGRLDALLPARGAPPEAALKAAANCLASRWAAEARAAPGDDAQSPWRERTGWRLNAPAARDVTLRHGDKDYVVSPGAAASAARAEVLLADREILVYQTPRPWVFSYEQVDAAADAPPAPPGAMSAPLPGKVTAVLVALGDQVEAGAALIRIEAMKMEHVIRAPKDGVVSAIHAEPGDQVSEGDVLVAFAQGEAAP